MPVLVVAAEFGKQSVIQVRRTNNVWTDNAAFSKSADNQMTTNGTP